MVVPFYLLYIFFGFFALLRHRNFYRAYRAIPFMRSAYRLETSTNLSPLTMAYHWLRCIK